MSDEEKHERTMAIVGHTPEIRAFYRQLVKEREEERRSYRQRLLNLPIDPRDPYWNPPKPERDWTAPAWVKTDYDRWEESRRKRVFEYRESMVVRLGEERVRFVEHSRLARQTLPEALYEEWQKIEKWSKVRELGCTGAVLVALVLVAWTVIYNIWFV